MFGVLLVSMVSAAEPGTYTPATRYETISDPAGYTIWFQVHYPAVSGEPDAEPDLSGGPYPMIAFIHGYLGQAWMYQTAADAFASMGFVVVNMDTETHPMMDPYELGRYTQLSLQWAEARSGQGGNYLSGMVSGDPWTVMAHSLGGVSMAYLVDLEPKVQYVVGFAPYREEGYVWDAYRSFAGSGFLMTGSEDTTSTAPIVHGWFEDMDAPKRGMFGLVHGIGHQAVTDIELEPATLSDGAQLEVSVAMGASFLEAEFFGEENAYDGLLCSAPADFDGWDAKGSVPATSAVVVSDQEVRLGLLGITGDRAVVYVGEGPGESGVEEGMLGIAGAVRVAEVRLERGGGCENIMLPPELAGRAWLQVVYAGDTVRLGRVVDLFGVGDSAGGFAGDPVGHGDTSDAQKRSGCGCATTGGLEVGWALLGLLGLRTAAIRRR